METGLTHTVTEEDLAIIRKAKHDMVNLSWAIKGVNKLGGAIESGSKLIPDKMISLIQRSTENILLKILKTNLLTLKKNKEFKKPSKRTYKAIVTASGAGAGFFGSTTGVGTAIFISEMTVTTKFLMRTILDIARSQGENIYTAEAQMECLKVFALGGSSESDDGLETSYYLTRAGLTSALGNVSASSIKAIINSTVAGASAMGSNVITKFITQIASRLSILITEKAIAQAVPIAGAVGGGSINFIFINHFQKMATAHFSIRRLERKYGEELVRKAYEKTSI
ncbi:EcsC family protein [Meridianimaribacter sp. CL38]|uniref:EcsC family protein n=1 Tax=Meridianimaribacter sp. CL38 TaxID=2213021 RepID=UPI001040C43E|nr:EcsC family protein [Meridianimaribacter sp. CL38]TBV26547.1 EcsC family protein [Meridianimaribacter sp. CL38]